MFRRFRSVTVNLVSMVAVLAGTVVFAHYLGSHSNHTHHENERNTVLHQHWNGCYKHVTYDHVDYVHHYDENNSLVDHTYTGPTGAHMHESYYNFYSC